MYYRCSCTLRLKNLLCCCGAKYSTDRVSVITDEFAKTYLAGNDAVSNIAE